MIKDPTEFRLRFQRWKNGEQVYSAGLPKYDSGKLDYGYDYISRATRYVALHEGFVPNVYDDVHANLDYAKKHGRWNSKHQKWALPTAGYGWTAKEDLHSWTREEADSRLRQDILRYDRLLRSTLKTYDNLTDEQRMALIDLYHQGGTGVFKKMPNFYNALSAGDIERAYRHLDFGSTLTPNRNKDRKNLFMHPEAVRSKEIRDRSVQVAKEMSAPTEAVRSTVNSPTLPILKQKRAFDNNVPETISARSMRPSEAEAMINALVAQQLFRRLREKNSIEATNENSATRAIGEMLLNNMFNLIQNSSQQENKSNRTAMNSLSIPTLTF